MKEPEKEASTTVTNAVKLSTASKFRGGSQIGSSAALDDNAKTGKLDSKPEVETKDKALNSKV